MEPWDNDLMRYIWERGSENDLQLLNMLNRCTVPVHWADILRFSLLKPLDRETTKLFVQILKQEQLAASRFGRNALHYGVLSGQTQGSFSF